MNWQALFLSANGRIGQKDFWISFLILFVAGLVLGAVLGMVPLLGFIVQLAMLYPTVCVTSKRLHDMGKSGWLAAVPYGLLAVAMLPVALAGVAGLAAGGAAAAGSATGVTAGAGAALGLLAIGGMLMMLASLVCLAFVLWVGLSKGDPAPNQYGSPTPSQFGGTTTTAA